jgi:hypothetical protein
MRTEQAQVPAMPDIDDGRYDLQGIEADIALLIVGWHSAH